MTPRRQLRIGALGTVAAGLCCFTPLLAWTLALAGLGAAAAWLDLVLLPMLAGSLVLVGVGWWRLRRAGQAVRAGGHSAHGEEQAMEPLTLITFEGCPNAPRAREALREAGCAFRELRQDDLPPGHPHRGYTSPTILAGDHVLHGMASGEAGCSLVPPEPAALRAGLEALKRAGR